jgi:AraC-like DNA-binding protein
MLAEPLRGRHISHISDLENAFGPRAECIQLAAVPFSADIFALATQTYSIVVVDGDTSYQVRRYVEPGHITVVYAERSRGFTVAARNGLTRNDLVVVREAVLDASVLGRSRSVWIDIDVQAFRDLHAPLPYSGQVLVLTIDDADCDRLHSAVPDAVTIGYAGDLLQATISALRASAIKPGPNKRERKMYALARRVEAFMWDNVTERISIARMCKGAGCRTRNVTYCFKDIFGLGPIAYFKLRRLAAVHRRLRDPHSRLRIMDVAAEFGFWHMGHFSTDYRRVFGETATETIAATRTKI